jgi:hypothetical protein
MDRKAPPVCTGCWRLSRSSSNPHWLNVAGPPAIANASSRGGSGLARSGICHYVLMKIISRALESDRFFQATDVCLPMPLARWGRNHGRKLSQKPFSHSHHFTDSARFTGCSRPTASVSAKRCRPKPASFYTNALAARRCCVFCSYGSVKCPLDAEQKLHLFTAER